MASVCGKDWIQSWEPVVQFTAISCETLTGWFRSDVLDLGFSGPVLRRLIMKECNLTTVSPHRIADATREDPRTPVTRYICDGGTSAGLP